MYAGTVSPSDPILAALTLSLHLSATPLSERHLSLITGQPKKTSGSFYWIWKDSASPPRTEAGWTCGTVPPSLLGAMAATVRAKIPESRMPHYLGFLLPDAPLEECELVVRYLDEELNQQAPEPCSASNSSSDTCGTGEKPTPTRPSKKARSTRSWSSSCRASACSSTTRCRWRSS